MQIRHPGSLDAVLARVGLVLVVIALAAGRATGQAPPAAGVAPPELPSVAAPQPVGAAEIRDRLREVDKAEGLDEPTRARLRELYESALAELDQAEHRAQDAATFAQKTENAADARRQVEHELGQTSTEPDIVVPEVADLAQLAKNLAAAEESLARAKEQLATLEAEPKRRANRKKEIPALQNSVRQEIEQLAQQILTKGPTQDSSPLARAEQTRLRARHQRLEQELAALERESAFYDGTGELIRRQRDLAALRMLQANAAVDRWREIVEAETKEKADDEIKQAQRAVRNAPPVLRPLAEDLETYALRSDEISQKTRSLSEQQAAVGAQLDDLEKRFRQSRQRVGAAGLTYATGSHLRAERARLPDAGYYDRRRRARRAELRDAELELFNFEDQRAEMIGLDRQVQNELAKITTIPPGWTQDQVERNVRDLLIKTREQFDTLLGNQEKYFDALVRLDGLEQRLVQETREYAGYIDERIFWIGSTDPLKWQDVRHARHALWWFVRPDNWRDVGQALATEARQHALLDLVALLLFGVLLYYQKSLRVRLGRSGEAAKRSTAREILPTTISLGETLLIAMMWPVVLGYVGWRLEGSLAPSDFVRAVAAGLESSAVIYFALELARQVCRRNGLGEAHFGWPPRALEVVRHSLKWLIPAVLPLVFLGATFHAQNNESLQNSLGRLSAIAALMLAAVFAHRVLRPAGPFFREMSVVGREGWPYRLRHVWYALGVCVPLVLALLAGWGYYYTCLQLAVRLAQSVCVPLGLAVVGAFFYRWVMVLRRRLAIDRMREKLAAAAATAAAQEAAATEGNNAAEAAPTAPPAEPEVDLGAVADQTRRLIHALLLVTGVVCLWWVWADALPALGHLEEVSIVPSDTWPGEKIGLETGADGLTLADVGRWCLVLLVVAMTVVAARNVPGLLAIAIPRQLPLDAGARYAITTISRYAITVIGLVWACSLLGIHWSTVQWLVAAVSVGLGFGLQEVFANFVCGLILLFERPIRVGDIVTVGDVSGVVSRIQIRATTVTDWDRKELIVPNKEFITGRLLNWTLSDPVNRIVINVGISYACDPTRARELLLEIARNHRYVMTDPKPVATFEGFGESALNLVLRCYLPTLENRLQTIHELHTEIHRVFAAEGIEIAFPQLDLHVRSGLPGPASKPDEPPQPRGTAPTP